MSINARVTLAPGARVGNVATVLAVAAGLPHERRPLGGDGGAWYAHVPGVAVVGIVGLAACTDITLSAETVDGARGHNVLYHHEWDEGEVPGCTGLLPVSTPFWVAVMLRVVDFFGGAIDYVDSDASRVDYVAPVAHRYGPTDAAGWQAVQRAMSEVEPVTADDLLAAAVHAAYDLADSR